MKTLVVLGLLVFVAGCAQPSVQLHVDPATVQIDGSSIVSWTSNDVNDCDIAADGFGTIGNGTNGSVTLALIVLPTTHVTAACNDNIDGKTKEDDATITCTNCTQ